MRLNTLTITAILLGIMCAFPTASALVIQVPQSLRPEGGLYEESFSKNNGIDFSFNFASANFNTTGFDNKSIREGAITVDYYVDEVEATGFGNFFGKVLGNVEQSREYRSTFVISDSDYMNITTLFSRKTGLLQGFSWQICNTLTFYANGTTHGAGTDCETNTIGGSPNHITHVFKMGWVYGNGTEKGIIARVFTDETRQGGSLITSQDLMVNQSDLIANGYISSVVGSLRNLANDASTTKIRYLFTTFENHAAITQATEDAASKCKENRGFVSAVGQTLLHWATLGNSPDCFTAEDAINYVFGFVNTALSVVFGFFPGGDKLAAFITQLLAIVIGIPIFATTMFLSHPAMSFTVWTWYFALIGTLRFAFGAEFAAIYNTPLAIWRAVFKGILAFGKWLYETVIAIFSAISGVLG